MDSGDAESQRCARDSNLEVPGFVGAAKSCGVGGGGSKVLLGLLMSPSPVSVRSATCSPSMVWTSAASAPCLWAVGVRGAQDGGLSAEPGLVPGLSWQSWAGPRVSRRQGALSLPLPGRALLLQPLARAGEERAGSVGPWGRRRNSGSTRSSFLSSPRWSSALLLWALEMSSKNSVGRKPTAPGL